MKLKQLWEVHTAPMKTGKKISLVLAMLACVVWTAGFNLVNVSVKVGVLMLFIFTPLFMMSAVAFTWEDKPSSEHQPSKPKIKEPQPKDY